MTILDNLEEKFKDVRDFGEYSSAFVTIATASGVLIILLLIIKLIIDLIVGKCWSQC